MFAKMKIRKLVIKDHSNSLNLNLLKSSLWDAKLFPDAIAEKNKMYPVRNMAALMGLGGMPNYSGQNSYPNTQKSTHQTDPNNYQNRGRNMAYNTQPFRDHHQGGVKLPNKPQSKSDNM